MKPEDIQKYIHDGIESALKSQLQPAIQVAVDGAVNGKVNALTKKVDALVDQTAPITQAYGKWLSARRNAFLVVGLLIAIGSFIQSVQAVWGLVTTYFSVGVR
jgi:hypothetical protein